MWGIPNAKFPKKGLRRVDVVKMLKAIILIVIRRKGKCYFNLANSRRGDC